MDTPKRFLQGVMTGAAAQLFVVPAGRTQIVKHIAAANSDAAADIALLLYLVPSGSAAGVSTLVVYTTLAPISTALFDVAWVLTAGDSIWGFATTTNKIAVSIHGIEIT